MSYLYTAACSHLNTLFAVIAWIEIEAVRSCNGQGGREPILMNNQTIFIQQECVKLRVKCVCVGNAMILGKECSSLHVLIDCTTKIREIYLQVLAVYSLSASFSTCTLKVIHKLFHCLAIYAES